MLKIKDAIQSMVDEAESKTELLAQDILEEVAEISGTVTFGLISLLAKAIRTFKSLSKKKKLKCSYKINLETDGDRTHRTLTFIFSVCALI